MDTLQITYYRVSGITQKITVKKKLTQEKSQRLAQATHFQLRVGFPIRIGSFELVYRNV